MTDLTVVFVQSEQPAIYRGWVPADASDELNTLGIATESAFIKSFEELRSSFGARGNILIWPVCYTLGPDPDGPLLTALLDGLHIPYIGLAASSVEYSSKLRFKNAIAGRTQYRSPDHIDYLPDTREFAGDMLFPAVVKTEFSCNSEGVWLARDVQEAHDLAGAAHAQTGQAVFVERWERHSEYTVGYLPGLPGSPSLAAAMMMTLIDGRPYLDREAKSDNRLLRFSRPEAHVAHLLEEMTIEIARELTLDGHFRMDVVMNADGKAFPIELNLLPYLTRRSPNQSYFPLAFELAGMLNYGEVIRRILAHAVARAWGEERVIALGLSQ